MTTGPWAMWAGIAPPGYGGGEDAGVFLYTFPDPRYVEAHGHEPVEVHVHLDDDGPYWAWLDNPEQRDADDFPEFIWHRKMFLDMCFAYGPEAEEKARKGRVVRCRIEQLDMDKERS